MSQKIMQTIKKHPRILLILVILFTACIVYHQYIFGNAVFLFRDIGCDTTEQYIMQYSSIVNHIRSGHFSWWDLTNGFGTSMYQLILFHPALWIVYLAGIVFGVQAMPSVLIYVHILILVLAGLAVWKFLSCFRFSLKAKFLASYIYAFNGFIIVWGQHYQFGILLVFLPLLLSALENALRKRKFSPWVVLCTALMVLCSYYMSYMVLVTAAVYVILRMIAMNMGSVKNFFKEGFRQAVSLILGIFMGSLNLLPSVGILFNVSQRLSSGDSVLAKCIAGMKPYAKSYYKTLAYRFSSSNLQGIGNGTTDSFTGYINYYEAPALFFSSLFLLLLIPFLLQIFSRKHSKRERLVQILAVFGGFFALFIQTGSLIFNAFAYPFSRHTFLYMPFFALIVAYMLDKIMAEKKIALAGMGLGLFAVSLLYAKAYTADISSNVEKNAMILMISAFYIAVILVMLTKSKSIRLQNILYGLLVLAVGINIGSDAAGSVAGRGSVVKGSIYYEQLYGEDFTALSRYLAENDPEFYRMEKDYFAGSYCMDALGQGYYGVSTYNSTQNRHVLALVQNILPEMEYVNSSHISYAQVESESDYATLFGIKYLVSCQSDLDVSHFEKVKQFGTLYLYENTEYQGFATYYTKSISESAYQEISYAVDTENLLTDYVILEDDYAEEADYENLAAYTRTQLENVTVDKTALSADITVNEDDSYTWTVAEAKLPLLLPKDIQTGEEDRLKISFDLSLNMAGSVSVSVSDHATAHIVTADHADLDYTTSLTISPNLKQLIFRFVTPGLQVTVSDIKCYYSNDPEPDDTAEGDIVTVLDPDESHITATANVDEDGVIVFPVSYEEGWSVLVDGESGKLLKADYGFMAVELTAGNHTVELTYSQPWLKEALFLSAGAWGIFLIVCVVGIRKRRG